MAHCVEKSWKQWNATKQFLAHGSSTNSKAASLEGAEPALIVRGKGCRVWDADGNEYIDFRNALGPVTIGYAVDAIDEAVITQLRQGIIFGHPHPLEGEAARLLCEAIPCAEKVRFLKTGGEAIAACIKIARAATARDMIIHCGYNGWINNLCRPQGSQPRGVAMSRPDKGVPAAVSALHLSLPWADREAWEDAFAQHGSNIAAAVVAANYESMNRGAEFLPFVRELTARYGTLLIMDEIVTGFRLALGGAHEYFGIMPDLAVFGKGMANGMPIAAYVGRADLLDTAAGVGITTTFGGETLSLAAVKASITFYREHDVIGHIWKTGEALWEGARDLFRSHKAPVTLNGLNACPRFTFTEPDRRDPFFAAAYRNGLSFYDVSYVNYSHTATDVQETLKRLQSALEEV